MRIRRLRSRSSLAISLVIALFIALFSSPSGATAHQPVTLNNAHRELANSPILLDGTISFAIYATMTKARQERFLRFQHRAGEQVKIEYLIPDEPAMKKTPRSLLPTLVLIDPSGKESVIKPNERTYFFEPFGKKGYYYLSRYSSQAVAGTYSIRITSKRASSVVIAVGSREIPGEVLTIGNKKGECPVRMESESEISSSRAEQLIGMIEAEAELCAATQKWGYRIGERDGESFAVTMDYRSDRITVGITKGVITKVTVG